MRSFFCGSQIARYVDSFLLVDNDGLITHKMKQLFFFCTFLRTFRTKKRESDRSIDFKKRKSTMRSTRTFLMGKSWKRTTKSDRRTYSACRETWCGCSDWHWNRYWHDQRGWERCTFINHCHRNSSQIRITCLYCRRKSNDLRKKYKLQFRLVVIWKNYVVFG